MKNKPASKHHNRRRNKRIFITLASIILVALVCLVCFFAREASTKFDAIENHLAQNQTYTDSMVSRLDSLSSHVSALHEITETNRSRSKQIAIGTDIITKARRRINRKHAEHLANILYDATEDNETIDYAFLLAVIESESKFNKDIVSPAGAVGLGQLMPRTAESLAKKSGMTYDVSMLTDPGYNVRLSVQYLMKLFKMFQNKTLVAAAYNGGPGGARKYKRWIEGDAERSSVHKETLSYVDKVMTRYNSYRAMLQ